MNAFDSPLDPKNFSSVTGLFSASILHSVSSSFALGAEWNLQKPNASIQESAITYAVRWAPPPIGELPLPSTLPPGAPSPYMPINPKAPTQIFTSTFAPDSGMLHSSYWRRLNQRLEMVTELQMLLAPTRREGLFISLRSSLSFTAFSFVLTVGIATFGFKFDAIYASIRASIESTGRLTTILEEKVTPALGFSLNTTLDYPRSSGTIGFGTLLF
jgi:mitochondrial import receptor subunit TOM40